MNSKLFPKKLMQEILFGECEKSEIIRDTIISHGRWSVRHELIFRYKDEIYRCTYSQGATEQQDETPFEYDDEMINCVKVKPVERMVTVYEEA